MCQWRTRRTVLAVLAVVCFSAAACTPAEAPSARAAGEAFQTALRSHQGNAACQLLSDEARGNLESGSGKRCAQAIAGLGLPVGMISSVEVWGGNSQVRLDTGVLFLAQFKTGWKVTAAGCRPRSDQPYDCDVEG
jgi:hypothetical protein